MNEQVTDRYLPYQKFRIIKEKTTQIFYLLIKIVFPKQ